MRPSFHGHFLGICHSDRAASLYPRTPPDTMNSEPSSRQSSLLLAGGVALALLGAIPTATAADASDAGPKLADAPPPARVHARFNLEIASSYLTPRGLIVEDQGVVIQPLFLMFVNLWQGDQFINEVTLVPGVWNSFHSRQSGPERSRWNETDPVLGVTAVFADAFTLGVTYTVFKSQNGSFRTSQHLETKLGFNDTKHLKAFALHPSVIGVSAFF